MKKVNRCLILFAFLLLLTSQVAHAESSREIARLGRGIATSLAWRPDGKVLAVGSATGIWFYDENLASIGHLDIIGSYQIAWNASGEKLAVVNDDADKTLQVWQISKDIAGQKRIWSQSWTDKEWSPIDIAWEPNGQRLVTGDEDDLARVWEADSGKLITKLPAKGSYVAWSPDGSKLAISGDSVKIIDANSLKITNSINQFFAVGKVNWNYDSTLVSTGCNDTEKFTDFGGGCIWDTKTHKLVYSQELARVAWSSNASKFASFGTSGFESDAMWFEIHNSLTAEPSDKTGYSAFFIDVEWQPNKDIVTALASDGSLLRYDVNTKKFTGTSTLFTNTAGKLIWSPDSKSIVSIQNETQQLVWELPQSDKFAADPLITLNGRIGTYGPRIADGVWLDSRTLWSIAQAGDWEGRIAIYLDKFDMKTGQSGDRSPRIYTNCWFAFNSDLSKAACLPPDKKELQIWNIKSQSIDSTILIAQQANQIYWSPDNSVIATISSNSDEMSETIELWEIKSGKRISEYKTYGTAITNLSWSPNNQAFAVAFSTAGMNGMSNSVHVFQVADANQNDVINLSDVPEDLTTLQWSSDNQKLLIATYKTINLYKANDLSEIVSLKIPPTRTVSLSPDDKLLALGMEDGTIRIWDVADLMTN